MNYLRVSSLFCLATSLFCSPEYAALQALLNNYTRPMTVLALQPTQQKYELDIARQYPGTVVIADEKRQYTYDEIHTHYNNIILLSKNMSVPAINRLGDCEHFDVIIVADSLHAYASDLQSYINSVNRLGDHVIWSFSKTNKEAYPDLYQWFCNAVHERARVLQDANETIFCISRDQAKPRMLLSHYWFITKRANRHQVTSTFSHKELYSFPQKKRSKWDPGINLTTFVMLDGVYPTHAQIRSNLDALKTIKHGEFSLWNFVLRGASLFPIDVHDKRWALNQEICVKETLQLFDGRLKIDHPSMHDIINQYRNVLNRARVRSLLYGFYEEDEWCDMAEWL